MKPIPLIIGAAFWIAAAFALKTVAGFIGTWPTVGITCGCALVLIGWFCWETKNAVDGDGL